ncbi:MAG: leucine-rich repeat protein [Firmicutes bacterium]|nr:leucine-rich repeat protein [Bacillota bacterium]
MRRMISVALALVLAVGLLAVVPGTAEAASSGSCGTNLRWTLDDGGTLTITGMGEMTDYTSSSNVPWYSQRSQIHTVEIGDGVTSISKFAFSGCSRLTHVMIPDGVTSIGGSAFEYCCGLISVEISAGVINIGDWAFYDCTSLTTITVEEENNVYSSMDGVLFNKAQTELVQYPAGKGETYTIPDSVASIREGAFSSCSSLTNVEIPNSVTSIGVGAFLNCSSLANVEIPNSVTSIRRGTFYDCSSLASVKIGNSVTNIGKVAFYGCSNLASVTIPNSVTAIEDYAFYDCNSLSSICFKGTEAQWKAIEIGIGNAPLENVTFQPPSVIASGSCGTNLRWTLDDEGTLSITGTGEMTDYTSSSNAPWYSWRSQIHTVEIGDGVTSIGDYAFAYCSSLTSVTIPDSVNSIGGSAFYGCSGLTSVTIPDSVTNIGSGALAGCKNLTRIEVDPENPKYKSADGILFTKDMMMLLSFPAGLSGSYTVPNSVTGIGNNAFESCRKLTSVNISGNVTSIGISAFYNCSSLTNATIGNSVISIGQYAFTYCSSLSSVFIGNSVTNIDSYAFAGCDALRDVYYNGSAEDWQDIAIGSNNAELLNANIHYNAESHALTLSDRTNGAAAVTGVSSGGQYAGETGFTVSCVEACAVAYSTDGGQTYTRLTATAVAGGYRFTVDMTADTTIVIVKKGDANLNGSVNNQDATITKAANLQKRSLTPLEQVGADVNGNGSVNNQDVTKLKAALLQKTTLDWDVLE